MRFAPLALVLASLISVPVCAAEEGWITLFDGKTLTGWHKNPEKIGHGTGGEWKVEDGAIVGQQDPPGSGNGGILLTDRKFGDFELLIDMKPDWGVDSGLFLRSNDKGQCFQMMVDYHEAGNVGHIYGEGTGGFNTRPFEIFGVYARRGFVDEKEPLIGLTTKPAKEAPENVFTISGADWVKAWKLDDWNTARVLVKGNPPHITTWINGVKVNEFDGTKFSGPRYDKDKVAETLGREGSIAVQVHGGTGAWPKGAKCRWKNIKIRPLAAATTSSTSEKPASETSAGWQPIGAAVLAQVKPGYPGKTAGVTVDPASGDVFMVVPDNGLWKSTDHGETFARVDGGKVGGRCETGFALDVDPAGKRMMCFMIYGSSAWTDDAGKTWTATKTSHLDFGAVDWGETGKCMLALRHEAGGLLALTTDAGATWKDLQKGFTHVGVFHEKALLASKGKGILRSEDGGATWNAVSDVTPSASVLRVREKVGYWTTPKGLLVSRDDGKTWDILGTPVAGIVGPLFGKSAEHLMVVAKDGFHESTDAGERWKHAAPLPPGFTVGGVGPNYAWDAKADILYASSMGKDTFRYRR